MNIRIQGGQRLSGEITPSGSKNSAVAIIPASLLFDKPLTISNVPAIKDVEIILSILQKLGSRVNWNREEKTLEIDNSDVSFKNLEDENIARLKGTSLFWGPMLSRFKKVEFRGLPGGCTLGLRPLDTHYIAFRDLGVRVREDRGSAVMDASGAKPREIWLNEMSPTATENIITFATGLKGTTKVIGAASEPQVQDLCEFLIKCGAKISGVGSNVLEIEGGTDLQPANHDIFSDHYEITTFLALASVTGGKLKVQNALRGRIENIINTFRKFNINVEYDGSSALVESNQKVSLRNFVQGRPLNVKAQPWPGLPVDALPLFIPLALASQDGQVLFHNWMYEAGLFWTSELVKLGANIIMGDPHRIIVTAGNKLTGATLEAPFIIRAVVAMVMCAMIAEGESVIVNADALYRGHPFFAENLKNLGAEIEVIGSG